MPSNDHQCTAEAAMEEVANRATSNHSDRYLNPHDKRGTAT
ncbi:MAG: hypothetical protein WAW42_06825 [Candidatus Competibacteraceae bacterium]